MENHCFKRTRSVLTSELTTTKFGVRKPETPLYRTVWNISISQPVCAWNTVDRLADSKMALSNTCKSALQWMLHYLTLRQLRGTAVE